MVLKSGIFFHFIEELITGRIIYFNEYRLMPEMPVFTDITFY
jgi:hypothetical protein